MSSPGRLALTGSVFTLPLALIGVLLTLAGWILQKWASREQQPVI